MLAFHLLLVPLSLVYICTFFPLHFPTIAWAGFSLVCGPLNIVLPFTLHLRTSWNEAENERTDLFRDFIKKHIYPKPGLSFSILIFLFLIHERTRKRRGRTRKKRRRADEGKDSVNRPCYCSSIPPRLGIVLCIPISYLLFPESNYQYRLRNRI